LWFDERDDVGTRHQQRWDARKDVPKGNERDIDRHNVDRRRKIGKFECARVRFFDDHDTRIVSESPIELTVTHVVRDHSRRATPQKHVGEASGRCSDVERFATGDRYIEYVEGVGQLYAAPPDIWVIGLAHGQLGIFGDWCTCLLRRLAVDEHDARDHQRLRPFSRRRKPSLHEQLIESSLQLCL
jgi:hypothetical protein